MLRRLLFTIAFSAVLLSGTGRAAMAQGWTFNETVSHSGPGPCIPYPQLPPIVYATKEACEYNRQAELSNNGDDWSAYSDGSCLLVITCTPCVGSDIGPGSGGSGGSSLAGNPGNVDITGILTGNALFSPHDTRDVEKWINDFLQRNKSFGIPVEGMNPITSSDVPLTGNADFDRFYTEQMLRFEKPEQGGTVYLREGQNTVDPNDLKKDSGTGAETYFKGMSAETQYGQKFADKASLFSDIENGSLDQGINTGPYIDFARAAAVFGVGFLKKGAIPAIVIVDILAEDIKQGVQLYQNAFLGENEPIPGTVKMLLNTGENIATDVAGAYIGDKAGKAVASLTVKQVEGVLVSKGVLPGIAKISEKPKAIGEAVSTELGVLTGGNDLVEEWTKTKKKLNNQGK